MASWLPILAIIDFTRVAAFLRTQVWSSAERFSGGPDLTIETRAGAG